MPGAGSFADQVDPPKRKKTLQISDGERVIDPGSSEML
jgi:hypothetical protein